MKPLTLMLLILACWQAALGQTDTLKSYTTARVQDVPPEIDGLADDAAWAQVEWAGGDFRQMNPDKGKPATVQTKFKVLYDEKNLYIIIRAFDPEPDKIVRRMSRRDSFEGDRVEVNIDSYNDKRTAFSFTASVSGVKGDEYCSNNGDMWDSGWDPIWYLKTSIDSEGWLAEMRIPLSQLRFADVKDHTWGLQVMRIFFRNQERSVWQYIPPDAAGWVHLFASMKGITGIRPQKQLEIQPYIVTKTESFRKQEGDPYQTGKSSGADVGLDAKIGITSDITLDLTVNPDFGQVEADPSQVNLTAFELFFQERRPFFLEGSNTLNFPVSQFNSNNLFYSRRIGRPPQMWADPDASGPDMVNEYVKPNTRTTILGAAKITGKNKRGFSWGVLETLTPNEYAEIDSLGYKRKQIIEPMTNYFVSRAQQDINKGNTIIGAMFTATNRKIDDARLNWLHKAAYTGGVDLVHHWKNRKYYVSSQYAFSHVSGSTEAISNTQLSSERYYQRPDNHHTEFDPTRTSLTGSSGQVVVGKKSGDLVADLGVVWQSPALELNDVGFLSQTDNITQWFWTQYRILQPKGITRWQRYNINQWQGYDFGMRQTSQGYNVNAHVEFKNFWRSGGGVTYRPLYVANADLRGGPSLRYPSNIYYWGYFGTDPRKKLNVWFNPEFGFGDKNYSREMYLSVDVTYQPINALNFTVSPSFSRIRNEMQYVTTTSSGAEARYLVGEIDQSVARVSMRATLMLTPNLSVQYWGQPFGTSGKYADFKYITNPRSESYNNRFVAIPATSMADIDGGYAVDEDLNGSTDYTFGRPDFNFGQFRSNMVIRWEYIPGSTVFLVWTRERNGAFYDNDPNHRHYSLHFTEKGHNIFLLKFTYRFVL
ncbi:MAG TPA: DUF5916 domain-containing protein [Chryseosolibacter sp.]|nr:DUF5916 domain-containing protein [Chryseosolibacter sp.]